MKSQQLELLPGQISGRHYDAFTLGFSNRTWDKTIDILHAYRIRQLVDIRTLPGSRHTPQFNLANLEVELPRAGVEYIHMKPLGGLRKPDKSSLLNAGWRNDGFRGFADYMQTAEFKSSLDRLAELIAQKTTAYACTEAVFWRCHRQLVSDALLLRGLQIGHIFDAAKVEAHELTKFAKVNATDITYP